MHLLGEQEVHVWFPFSSVHTVTLQEMTQGNLCTLGADCLCSMFEHGELLLVPEMG